MSVYQEMMTSMVLHSSLTTPFLGNITHHMASEDHGWNLILVNRENYIPADYEVQLTELSNGKKVDSRIYPELQEILGVSRPTIYNLLKKKEFRWIQLDGGKYRISKKSFDDWLDNLEQ